MTYNSCIWLTVEADSIEQAREAVRRIAESVSLCIDATEAWAGDTEEDFDE